MTIASAGLRLDSPYPGLRSFEPTESVLFFGRESHTRELLGRLSQSRFLSVVGTSGSGKSSLVRAGLLPALYRGYLVGTTTRWRIAIMRPGNAPVANLARALASEDVLQTPDIDTLTEDLWSSSLGLVNIVRRANFQVGESLLIVVDQFEELFRFPQNSRSRSSGSDAAQLVSLLLRAAREFDERIYVVITMRSDFLGDCSSFAGLTEALNNSQYLIPRLTLEQRKAAIEKPATLVGATVSQRLIQRLLVDAGDEPDQLPVIQHAMMRIYKCWRQEGTSEMDVQEYAAIRKDTSALDQHATQLYDLLDDDAKSWAEKLFRCLTVVSGGRALRRPARLRWIYAVTNARSKQSRGYIDYVIQDFCRPENSLLTCSTGHRLTGRSVIDISHECLIRRWSLLERWVEAEAESAFWYRDIAGRIKRRAALLQDPDLGKIEAIKESTGWNNFWGSQYVDKRQLRYRQVEAFLARSRSSQTEENLKWSRSLRKERWLFWSVISSLSLLICSVALLLLLYNQGFKKKLQDYKNLTMLFQKAQDDKTRLQALEAKSNAAKVTEQEALKAEVEEAQHEAASSQAEAEKAKAQLSRQQGSTFSQASSGTDALQQIAYLQDQLRQTHMRLDNANADKAKALQQASVDAGERANFQSQLNQTQALLEAARADNVKPAKEISDVHTSTDGPPPVTPNPSPSTGEQSLGEFAGHWRLTDPSTPGLHHNNLHGDLQIRQVEDKLDFCETVFGEDSRDVWTFRAAVNGIEVPLLRNGQPGGSASLIWKDHTLTKTLNTPENLKTSDMTMKPNGTISAITVHKSRGISAQSTEDVGSEVWTKQKLNRNYLDRLPTSFSPVAGAVSDSGNLVLLDSEGRLVILNGDKISLDKKISDETITGLTTGTLSGREAFFVASYRFDTKFWKLTAYSMSDGASLGNWNTSIFRCCEDIVFDSRRSSLLIAPLHTKTAYALDLSNREFSGAGEISSINGEDIYSLSLDALRDRVFVSYGAGMVNSITLKDGKNHVILNDESKTERAIAVDGGHNVLYFATSSGLSKVGLDVKNQRPSTFVNSNLAKGITSLAVDLDGKVWAFNSVKHSIMCFQPDGTLLDSWAKNRAY